MFTAQFYLQAQRCVALWCGSKAACHTPVPLQPVLAKFHVAVPAPLFFSKCFHTDDELADDSSIAKTGFFFFDLRLFCAFASGTNNSNNETKFEHRWTNTFIRIFHLFVSPLLIIAKFFSKRNASCFPFFPRGPLAGLLRATWDCAWFCWLGIKLLWVYTTEYCNFKNFSV